MQEPRYVVVAGASAGGLQTVIELAAQLTEEMDIAVFVVLHLNAVTMPEVLVQKIQKNTVFTCKLAEHGEPIRRSYLYLAVPDKHLLLQKETIVLGSGTAENRWRPSIDVLFRSAAATYDGRVIGIIMTGLLQDGTAGMQAVKRCGGTVIVQDPAEAEYPDMPLSVMENMQVDFCLPLSSMGAVLLEKSRNGITEGHIIPEDIKKEAQIAERVATGMNSGVRELGERSVYSCPDCSGALWEVDSGDMTRYRCQTGHAYTEMELSLRQSESLENTLWVALRMLEERKSLLQKMAKEEAGKGWMRSASAKTERAGELEDHISRLKDILFHTKDSNIITQSKTA